MQTDYPELRDYLSQQEGFENYMKKSIYLCIIKDNEAYDPIKTLELNAKIFPSTIVVVMPDNSYKEFWLDVYEDQKNIPYEIRLASYSKYYLIF